MAGGAAPRARRHPAGRRRTAEADRGRLARRPAVAQRVPSDGQLIHVYGSVVSADLQRIRGTGTWCPGCRDMTNRGEKATMGKKVFVDLSHPFGADIPRWPYFVKPVDRRHAHPGQVAASCTQKITAVQHCGTHADAPRHVMERDFDGNRARYSTNCRSTPTSATRVCLDIQDRGLGPHHAASTSRTPASAPSIKPEDLKGMVDLPRPA